MVRVTLASMAAGGIYDHLAGGFHRYSTDERWLIPLFEKMLYDNALLAIAYLDAHEVTGDQGFASVARETLDYLSREMTLPEGGFCCSQDAESPEGEGIFHTWTPEEIGAVLDAETADLFSRAYDVDDVGNFEGRCVVHRVRTDQEVAAVSGLAEADVRGRLEEARRALYQARERRPKPARDEKVLLDWNGLAVSAFARGSRALGEPDFLRTAEKAAGFLLRELNDGNGNLLHMWLGGAARVPAFLDDHAAMLVGLIDLHEASGNADWLREASRVLGSMKERFWDDGGGGFFDTGEERRDLIARTKHAEDSGAPSGNSLAACGMIRLARMTGDSEATALAERTLRCFVHSMETIPSGAAHMLLALDLYLARGNR
ncbi:MAG: thioredoxin domain-containing protein [Candidatus Eisenbacteria bacterium]|nr:thioredoxin domain-containing protein [Candidatus Eisenbacteria bacterium]